MHSLSIAWHITRKYPFAAIGKIVGGMLLSAIFASMLFGLLTSASFTVGGMFAAVVGMGGEGDAVVQDRHERAGFIGRDRVKAHVGRVVTECGLFFGAGDDLGRHLARVAVGHGEQLADRALADRMAGGRVAGGDCGLGDWQGRAGVAV